MEKHTVSIVEPDVSERKANAATPSQPPIAITAAKMRRASIAYGMGGRRHVDDAEEELLRIFLATRGLTNHDVENAFDLLSKDGRKVTPDDVHAFVEDFFGGVIPPMSEPLFQGWKDDMTRDQLSLFLLTRPMTSTPFEHVFEWFSPTGEPLKRDDLVKLIRKYSPDHTVRKRDVYELLRRFDRDRDGTINLEDFKRMGI